MLFLSSPFFISKFKFFDIFLFLCNLCNFLFLCSACYYNQRTIPYFSWFFRSLARSFPVLLFSFCVVFMQTSMFSRGGRWDFRFWPFFKSVVRFYCPLRFPVFPFFNIWLFDFLAKIKQVRFLFGSLCSQMLGYFICFNFTVNPGQTAMWDSGYFYHRFKAIAEPRTVLKRKFVWKLVFNCSNTSRK